MVSISIHGEDADWIVCPTVDYFILTSLLTPPPPALHSGCCFRWSDTIARRRTNNEETL